MTLWKRRTIETTDRRSPGDREEAVMHLRATGIWGAVEILRVTQWWSHVTIPVKTHRTRNAESEPDSGCGLRLAVTHQGASVHCDERPSVAWDAPEGWPGPDFLLNVAVRLKLL